MVFAVVDSMRTTSVEFHDLYSTILKGSPEGEGFAPKDGYKNRPIIDVGRREVQSGLKSSYSSFLRSSRALTSRVASPTKVRSCSGEKTKSILCFSIPSPWHIEISTSPESPFGESGTAISPDISRSFTSVKFNVASYTVIIACSSLPGANITEKIVQSSPSGALGGRVEFREGAGQLGRQRGVRRSRSRRLGACRIHASR